MKQALVMVDIQNDYFENGRFPLFAPEAAAAQAAKVLEEVRRRENPIPATTVQQTYLASLNGNFAKVTDTKCWLAGEAT